MHVAVVPGDDPLLGTLGPADASLDDVIGSHAGCPWLRGISLRDVE